MVIEGGNLLMSMMERMQMEMMQMEMMMKKKSQSKNGTSLLLSCVRDC